MATAFEQILEIKQRKEEQAQTEARATRLAAEQAALAVEQRRSEAEAFSKELLVRQARLYDGLEGKVVERREVDDVRESIALLRAHETSLYEKIKEAEVARAKAAEALEAARAAHQQAVKNVEKFVQLVSVEQAQVAAEEQAGEDKEMEEFIRLGEPADA
jgi:hypothetical protein